MTKPNPIVAAIRDVFPKITAIKLGELLDAIEDFIPAEDCVESVSVAGTRGVVQTIEAHGLVLGLDALGRAAEVRFPDGATWKE